MAKDAIQTGKLTIPVKPEKPVKVKREKQQIADSQSARIVLLCDQECQQGEITEILQDAGYVVDVFDRIASLKSICKENKIPAAVILDMAMDDIASLADTVSAMNSQCQLSVPVIYLAPRQNIATRLAAYRAGITRYLPKPFSKIRLLQMITAVAVVKPAQSYQVMLVEEDAELMETHADILRRADINVMLVNDPLQVSEILEDFAADVLIMAMDMEQCTGPELSVILQDEEHLAAIPVIYLLKESDPLLQLNAITRSENYLSNNAPAGQLQALVCKHARASRKRKERDAVLRKAIYELERQQQALDSHAIVSVANAAGDIVFANEKFCEISGYSNKELIGKNHRIVKSGRHPAEMFEEMWSTICSGNIWHGEVCNRKKDGNLYWVSTSIVPFMDGQGLPYQYISIRTDITHIKENEERLNRSQEFANIGTWDWNIQAGGLVWSKHLARLFGHANGDIAHTYENFLNAVHPDDLHMVREAINDCVQRGISYNIEHRCVWPNGSVHWLLQRGDVVRDANGIPLHMLGLVQDITPRKQAELGLLESNLQLEEAQSLARLGNWTVDIEGGNMFWSDEVYRIFGQNKTRFETTIESFRSFIHPDDIHLMQEAEQRAVKTASIDLVLRIIRSDGEVRFIHVLSSGRHDVDGWLRHMRGTVQDVTELKQAEQSMLEAKVAAEEASRAKSEFLASMSHELRTPLNAILGFSQLFIMDDELPQATRNNSRQIERAGQHLLSLVNDLIDLARIESNKLELNMNVIDLKEVLSDSLTMVQSMAHDKGIRIIQVQCDVLNINLWADFNRLRQALINLLTNAIKYNRQNGTVHVLCEKIAGSVHIAITDTGPGIPESKQTRIFNAFDRLGEERGEVEGTGIGLVITKRIVETMRGVIGFESVEGRGSTFWMEFPMAENSDRSGSENKKSGGQVYSQPESRVGAIRPVVFYIEDNMMNFRLMQQIFSARQDWELLGAHDAESGIEMIRSNPPSAVLMDINLPGMDGFQALGVLKADTKTAHIPVIALSANAMKGDRENGIEAGFVDYLTKPLDIVNLLEVLDSLLR